VHANSRGFSSLLAAAWGLTGGCWPVGGMVLPTEAAAPAPPPRGWCPFFRCR